jgi:hypothetical protein
VMFGAASLGMGVASGLLSPLGARLVLVVSGSGGIGAGVAGWLTLAARRRAAVLDGIPESIPTAPEALSDGVDAT